MGGAVQIAMAGISLSMGTVTSSMGAAGLMGDVLCSMRAIGSIGALGSMGAVGSTGALGLMGAIGIGLMAALG